MYIAKVCRNWVDLPFWKSSFKLTTSKDLKFLQSCGVRDVWIDTVKGKDIAQAVAVEASPSVQDIDASLAQIARQDVDTEHRVSWENELEAARKIQTSATEVVTSMFNEVRMGKALRVENAIPLAGEIYLSVVRNPSALFSLTRLKTKDNYTYMHSVAFCTLMIALGRQMGIDEETVKSLGMAGLLHDVGKMAIPDSILNNPGGLTDAEFGLVKSHPERGWEMLKDSKDVDDIGRDVCLHHHERVDGTGYPEKLSADNLSLFAKMGAVCDVYDAIT
jgi:putative nucleotidyltransferase with HDIG domain